MRIVLMDKRSIVFSESNLNPVDKDAYLNHPEAILGMVVYQDEIHIIERESPTDSWTTIDITHKQQRKASR